MLVSEHRLFCTPTYQLPSPERLLRLCYGKKKRRGERSRYTWYHKAYMPEAYDDFFVFCREEKALFFFRLCPFSPKAAARSAHGMTRAYSVKNGLLAYKSVQYQAMYSVSWFLTSECVRMYASIYHRLYHLRLVRQPRCQTAPPSWLLKHVPCPNLNGT